MITIGLLDDVGCERLDLGQMPPVRGVAGEARHNVRFSDAAFNN